MPWGKCGLASQVSKRNSNKSVNATGELQSHFRFVALAFLLIRIGVADEIRLQKALFYGSHFVQGGAHSPPKSLQSAEGHSTVKPS
jgi:hypothetical protein